MEEVYNMISIPFESKYWVEHAITINGGIWDTNILDEKEDEEYKGDDFQANR